MQDQRRSSNTAEVMAAVDVPGLEATVRRRDAVLAAIAFASSQFLDTADWDRDIREVLKRLGAAVECSRVCLFEGHHDALGDVFVTAASEWVTTNTAPIEAGRAMDLEQLGLGRWKALGRGEIIHGPLASMPRSERAYFETLGVRSIALMPVFAGEAWWGYLGFADDVTPREWSRSVLEALQAAAATLGAAIYRKRAEGHMRESESRFRILTEAAFEGVFIHDRGVMIEANAALARIFGYELHEMIGRNMMDFIPTAESRERIARNMASGSRERYEVHASHSSGRLMTALITGRDTTYKGKPVRVTTVQDITEARRTEAELRHQATLLLEAQAVAHMGSWEWNIGTGALTASDEMYRIYGFERDAILSTAMILERIHPDDMPFVRRTMVDVLKTGADFNIEHRIVRATGDVRHFHVTGRVVKDDDGVPVRLIGAGQDVSARHEAERAARSLMDEQAARAAAEVSARRAAFLAEASRLLGSSLDYRTTMATLMKLAVPAIADFGTIDVLDPGGEVERVAVAHVVAEKESLLWELRRWLHVAGPIMAQLRGPMFDGKSLFMADVTDALLATLPINDEHGAILQQIRPRSSMTVPLTAGGKLTGALALYTSESGRRFDASDLALAEELARRTALAVENARLFQAAEAATRARDQMLGIVAHDLRNPLNTVQMAANMLGETLEVETPAGKLVAMVNRAVDRMNRLIGDLLDVKRLENGRLTVELQQAEAVALLTESVEMLRAVARARTVDLLLDIPPVLPPVMVDSNRIQQVLSNLIGNGIKFTPRGGRITVAGVPDREEVHVSVTDTGVGIPPEQLPHIFDQFWQGSKTDRRGIGLGLAIAKGIVDAHGGRIWVESTPDVGTSFHFTLPAIDVRPHDSANVTQLIAPSMGLDPVVTRQ